MTDTLSECRHCGSDACYEYTTEKSMTWRCMDCGFYTNTFMLKNSEMVKYLQDTSPDLFKDISYEDESGFIWWPMTINVSTIGILFPNGSSADNWRWSFAPEVLIAESERYKYPIKDKVGEYHSHKVDMTSMKSYDQMDFILALQEGGLLNYFLQ